MIHKLVRLLKTDTAKDATIMTAATGISAFLAALFFILVARLTDPERLGIFSLATAASFMLADIFDVALNASLIRFVSRELSKSQNQADLYLKFVFKLKVFIAITLFFAVFLFARPLSRLLFADQFQDIVILVGIGTGFQLLFSFFVSHLQARRLFFRAAQAIILLPFLRLLGLLIVILSNKLSVISFLYAYFFSTLLSILPSALLAPRKFLLTTGENQIARKYLSYFLPLTTGFSFSAISGRVDNFILANLSGSLAVGYYAAAFRMFSPLQFLVGSLSTVFAPRFASFSGKHQARVYLKKTILLAVFLFLLLIFLLPLSSLIIQILFGRAYLPSVSVFRVLLLGFGIFALQTPFISTIMYFLAKPREFAGLSILQLFLIVLINLLLVPKYAQLGAAFAFLITQISILVIAAVYVFFKMKGSRDE